MFILFWSWIFDRSCIPIDFDSVEFLWFHLIDVSSLSCVSLTFKSICCYKFWSKSVIFNWSFWSINFSNLFCTSWLMMMLCIYVLRSLEISCGRMVACVAPDGTCRLVFLSKLWSLKNNDFLTIVSWKIDLLFYRLN